MSLTLIAARRKSTVCRRGPLRSPDAPSFSQRFAPGTFTVSSLIRFSRPDLAHACLFSVSRCTAARASQSPARSIRYRSRVVVDSPLIRPCKGGSRRQAMMPVLNKRRNEMSATNETKKNAPDAKVSVGLQTASIWKNESEGRAFYNVTFDRRYRNAKGDWKSTDSYGSGRPSGPRQTGRPRPHEGSGTPERRRRTAGRITPMPLSHGGLARARRFSFCSLRIPNPCRSTARGRLKRCPRRLSPAPSRPRWRAPVFLYRQQYDNLPESQTPALTP